MEEDRNIKEPRVSEEPKEIQKPSDGSGGGGNVDSKKDSTTGLSAKQIAIGVGSIVIVVILLVAIFG